MTNARRRYYEWQTKGRDKLPHFTKHPDGKVMLMAGLYDETVDKSIVVHSTIGLLQQCNLRFRPVNVHVCNCHYPRKQSFELVT